MAGEYKLAASHVKGVHSAKLDASVKSVESLVRTEDKAVLILQAGIVKINKGLAATQASWKYKMEKRLEESS